MLKIMLKMMKKEKKEMIPQKHTPPPAFLVFPKLSAHPPKDDLLLENKRIMYGCGGCGHKFVLKSDVNLTQSTVAEWMGEVRSHNCHDNKKNLG